MITGDMKLGDILRNYPQTQRVFEKYGLDCHDCQIADLEEVEHGAAVHKIDIHALLEELNRAIS